MTGSIRGGVRWGSVVGAVVGIVFKEITIDLDTANCECSSPGLDYSDIRGNGAWWASEFNPSVSGTGVLWPGTAEGISGVYIITPLSRLATISSSHDFDRGNSGITFEANLLPVTRCKITVGTSLGCVLNVGYRIICEQLWSGPRPSWINTRLRGIDKFELDRSGIGGISFG